MIGWRFKSAIQRILSKLPFPYFWYGLLQEHVTRSITVNQSAVERRLHACQRHMQHFDEEREDRSAFTAFEVGTGWIPIIPLGLWLCGAKTVWTFDIAPLISRRRLNRCLGILRAMELEGRLAEILPQVRRERIEQLLHMSNVHSHLSCKDFLHSLGINLLVGQQEVQRIRNKSIDLVVSHEVLEYVPKRDIDELWQLITQSIHSGSIMSHYIDLRDEYSYFDPSISPLNFLRYSEQEWRWHANPLFPLNRLTLPDYRNLFSHHAFRILHEEARSAPRDALETVKLAEPFSGIREEDLLVLNVWIKAICVAPSTVKFCDGQENGLASNFDTKPPASQKET